MLHARVTAMPVVPDAARRATINVNGIEGGQRVDGFRPPVSPIDAARCSTAGSCSKKPLTARKMS